VSGHRLSTAEIESALIMHAGVAETAGALLSFFKPPLYRYHSESGHSFIVIGTSDELTGQAVHSFVTLKPCVLSTFLLQGHSMLTLSFSFSIYSEFKYDVEDPAALKKELTLQVRKVIGPFAAPKKIYIVNDLPKTRSGKVRNLLAVFLLYHSMYRCR